MAYDLHRIFLQVRHNLELTPSMSLAQLSRNLRIKRHTVEKAVKRAIGVTFREFRNGVLLRRAQDLLRDESNRTIKEVAFALGYRVPRSWQVTGIRQDAFANAHRIKVEEDKPQDQRGKHLYPDVFEGQAKGAIASSASTLDEHRGNEQR